MAYCCEKRAKDPAECELRISKKIKGRDISPLLLRQIARDIGMTMDEFLSYRP